MALRTAIEAAAEKMATRQAYGKTLVELGAENPNLVVMDADLSKSTMTADFAKAYPDRFFNMNRRAKPLCGGMRSGSLGKSRMRQHFCDVCGGKSF